MEQGKTYKSQASFVVEKDQNLPYGEFKAIIATESLDRHNEHVSVKGMKLPRKNYKIYWNHLTDGMNLPIGKWLKISKKNGQLVGHGKLAVDKYPFAKTVYDLMTADEGYIDSTSVSFMPEELDTDTMTWTKSQFVEASLVGEPANTEALVFAKKLGVDLAAQEKEFAEQVKSDDEAEDTDTTSEVGAGTTEVLTAVEELKSRVRTLEEAHKETNDAPEMKQVIRLRMAAKQVDHAADALNGIIKVKLKETL